MEVVQKLNKTAADIQELIDLFPKGWPVINHSNLREHYRSLRLAKDWTIQTRLVINSEGEQELPEESYIPLDWKEYTAIGKIDYVLQAIDKIIDDLPSYDEWLEWFCQEHIYSKCDSMSKENYGSFEEEAFKSIPDWSVQITSVWGNLMEAKMFLGFELEEIKRNM